MFLTPRSRNNTNQEYNKLLDNANATKMASNFPRVYGIAAVDEQMGLGKENNIPWHNKEIRESNPILDSNVKKDMILFRALTNNQICVVGRKTYESIINVNPDAFKSKKEVYVITNQILDIPHKFGTFVQVNNMILQQIDLDKTISCIYILGGAEIYKLYSHYYTKFILSRIIGKYDCDVFLPRIKNGPFVISEFNDDFFIKFYYGSINFNHNLVNKINVCQPVSKILTFLSSDYIENRCIGQKTRNTYNYSFTINIKGIIPLCPVRRQDINMIFHELMWFIRGETDIRILQKNGINIWNANALEAAKKGNTTCGRPDCFNEMKKFYTSYATNNSVTENNSDATNNSITEKYCENCALNIGRTYGAQWRRFGQSQFDQLAYIIQELKTNPYNRRIMLSSWCPPEIFNNASLPPCHVSYNFNVDEKRNLYCQVLQRSSDIGVGLSWNIASAGLLTHLIAKTCDLNAYSISFTLCNAHLYECNEIATLALYVYNPELKYLRYPKFEVLTKKEIEDYTVDDFLVQNYNSYSNIRFKMVL